MSLFDTHKPVGGGENKFPDAIEHKFTAPGSAVEGTVVDLSDRINGQYGEYRLATLENGGKHYKVLLGGVALDKAERGDVRLGAQLAVRFEGMKEGKKSKRNYKDYAVVVVPPADGAVSNGGVPASRPSASSDRPF